MEGSANARAGVLKVWSAGAPEMEVSADGSGTGVPCCLGSKTFPWSRTDIVYSGKVSRRYMPGFCGHGLHANPGPPKPGLPRALLEAELVKVKCGHGDVHEYPIVPLLIKFKGGMHIVNAAVSSHPSHPINLSTNYLGFKNLLGQYVGM